MLREVRCADCGASMQVSSPRQVRCVVCQHEHEKAARREYWRRLRAEHPEVARGYDARGRERRADLGRFDHSGTCVDCGQPIYRRTRRTVRCPGCQAIYAKNGYRVAVAGNSSR